MAIMNHDSVTTESLTTDKLILGGNPATGICDNLNTETDTSKLVNVKALKRLSTTINKLDDKLSPNSSFLEAISVMTPSLVNKYFTNEDEWILENWGITTEGVKAFASDKNSLTISTDVYPKAGIGNYYIIATVSNLPSGIIDVYVNDTFQRSLKEVGKFGFELVLNSATDVIKFVYRNGDAKDQAIIKELELHHLTDAFVKYLVTKIKQEATVNADEFMRKDELEYELDSFKKQFNQVSNEFIEQLTTHLDEENPHKITPELIKAAPEKHTHDEYETKDDLKNDVITTTESLYAPKEHYHSQYIDKSELDSTVADLVSTSLVNLVTLTPLTITDAKVGKLPQRYSTVGVSAPAQLLIPTNVCRHTNTNYDESLGTVDTDRLDLIDSVAEVFSNSDNYADLEDTVDGFNIRISFHIPRVIVGYVLKWKEELNASKATRPDTWSVISGDTTFIHRYVPTNEEYGAMQVKVDFDTPITVDSLTFSFDKFKRLGSITDGLLKIRLITENDTDTLQITKDTFKVCVPNSGANRVLTKDDNTIINLPTTKTEGTAYYAFVDQSSGNTTIDWSVIPPEYSNTRIGIDVFTDVFPTGAKLVEGSYSHPDYGTLTLKKGNTSEGELINLYKDREVWVSEETDNVIIEQTILPKHTVLTSYALTWNGTQENIPEGWTVTVEGIDNDNRRVTAVIDSVDKFYPFYSVADDDIIYFKKFDNPLEVTKITIAFTSKNNGKIALSGLNLYLSKYWYSIPANTIYNGLSASIATCIGSAYVDENTHWNINNTYIGKSATVPVNHLTRCSPGVYEVPNPFFTDQVMANVQTYNFTESLLDSQAYVSSISADKITVSVVTEGYYGLQLMRLF